MSNSLRYFTVTSANSVAGQPDILTRVRLGDTLPFANALVFIPEGQQIPGAAPGDNAPPGGTFVINQAFLPSGNGDLISAFARANSVGGQVVAIVTGTTFGFTEIAFPGDVVLKGLTTPGPNSIRFDVDNAGYYRVNAVLNIAEVAPGRNVTIAVGTAPLGDLNFFPVPQGTFTIVECPTTESLEIDVFTNELQAGGQIRVEAGLSTSDGSVGGGGPADVAQIAAGSRIEITYLGTTPI